MERVKCKEKRVTFIGKTTLRWFLTAVMIGFTIANVVPVAAQPAPPGETQGAGTYFGLPDSPYLPVTLHSSVTVSLTLRSVPEIVSLTIGADTTAGSAQFTLGGFAASKTYYRYTDNGLNPVTFSTDATGSFTYTQDLTQPHHVWFRDRPSTYHLQDDGNGGQCILIGTWSSASKTCTLTGNVSQSIFIQSDGITLDGNGFSLLAADNYYAVYSSGQSNVTVKNLNVSGSAAAIWLIGGNNITINNNAVAGGYYGIITYWDNNVSISNNTVSNTQYFGIYNDNFGSGSVAINGNTVSGASSYDVGIRS